MSMTKTEFVEAVQKASNESELTKKATADLIDCVFDTIAKAIKKDKRFNVAGFGVFTVKQRAARKGRNPRTGAEIKIKASKTVGFKVAPKVKKTL